MKLFITYITAKRCLYILILLLLLIILSGIFNLFSPQVILIFNIFLLITVIILFIVFPEEEKTRPGLVREKNRKEYPHLNSEDNENGFKTIADQIPFMVWRSDMDGKCIYVNKKWIEFTGVSYQEER
ncbi:PAS domain-containing protein [Pedobacter sp. NJ-S-72]